MKFKIGAGLLTLCCMSGCSSTSDKLQESTVLNQKIDLLEARIYDLEDRIKIDFGRTRIRLDVLEGEVEAIPAHDPIDRELKKVFPHTLQELAQQVLDQLNGKKYKIENGQIVPEEE